MLDVLGDETAIATLLLDRFDAPPEHEVEASIDRRVNTDARRLALVHVQRVASDATDALQAVDLLLGSITFERRTVITGDTEDSLRKTLSVRTLTDHYGLKSYLDKGGGRLDTPRLSVRQLPEPRAGRSRGSRGGAARTPARRA